MDLKELLKQAAIKKTPRIILHGTNKIGKSTFASAAPNPIYIQTEDGRVTEIIKPDGKKVDAFPVAATIAEVFQYLNILIEQPHDFKTVVVDTIDWFEKLIWKQVCAENSVEVIEKIGYSRGYNFALRYWDIFIEYLETLRNKGMIIILLAHNEIKTFNPPDNKPYDRWQIKLHKTASAKLSEWADCILFVNYVHYVTEKNLKGKATGGDERLLYTKPNPAYLAGNRYGLPETMQFDCIKLLAEIKKSIGIKGEN